MIPSVPQLQALSLLFRTKISLFMAFSACAGYLYFHHRVSVTALFVFVGVALLAASASAINQFQEHKADGLMTRTKGRPLPSGLMSSRQALVASGALCFLGLSTLFYGSTPLAALLGLMTLLWYNAIYTPLKRKTVFAAIIGAPTGAFAPLIGCAAAGVGIGPRALCIALFMFLWQVPHFLLLLFKYGEEYERAGFPTPASKIDGHGIKRIILAWLLAASVSTLLFPFFGVVSNIWITMVLCCGACAFAGFVFIAVKRIPANASVALAIRSMYAYQAFILILLVIEGFLSPKSVI